jgi:hypothetical protein
MNAIRYKKLIHYRKQVDDALFIPMSLIEYFYQTEFGFIAFMMFPELCHLVPKLITQDVAEPRL